MSERNKMVGHQSAGNAPTFPFFFPDDNGHPAVTVEARSRIEAEQKVAAMRGLVSDKSET